MPSSRLSRRRLLEQPDGAIVVFRALSVEQHGGVLIPGVREPRPRALPGIHFERGLEMTLGGRPALHRRREHAEIACRRTEAGNVGRRNDVPTVNGSSAEYNAAARSASPRNAHTSAR